MNKDLFLTLLLWLFLVTIASIAGGYLEIFPEPEVGAGVLLVTSAFSLFSWNFSTWIVLDFLGSEHDRTTV